MVTPPIEAAERLQGFPSGWTSVLRAQGVERYRWRLVGNAVSVPVAAWIGSRLLEPGNYDGSNDSAVGPKEPWPKAAWNMGDGRMGSNVSEYPVHRRRGTISAYATRGWPDLSSRALRGFLARAHEGHLRYPQGFLEALAEELNPAYATMMG